MDHIKGHPHEVISFLFTAANLDHIDSLLALNLSTNFTNSAHELLNCSSVFHPLAAVYASFKHFPNLVFFVDGFVV